MKRLQTSAIQVLNREEMMEIDGACSVLCQTNYYSCCSQTTCKCVREGEPQPFVCESGGEGSFSCSS